MRRPGVSETMNDEIVMHYDDGNGDKYIIYI